MAIPEKTKERIAEMLKDGKKPAEVAKAVGVSDVTVYAIRKKLGLPKLKAIVRLNPSAMDALNADILSEKYAAEELKAKHGISPWTVKRYRRRLKNGSPLPLHSGPTVTAGTEVPGSGDVAKARRVAGFLNRMADKYPSFLLELGIVEKIAKRHPDILMEVL